MIGSAYFLAAIVAVVVQSEPPEPATEVTATESVFEPDEDGRVIIDILAPPPQAAPPTQAEIQECEDDIDAARVTGEIIVCRRIGENPAYYYSGNSENAERRYAEETAFEGDIRAPDVAGAGIFRGPATISGLCIIPPCPKDPAIIIDVEALPEAPQGSDADRIAQGLPPISDEEGLTDEEIRKTREALGLPVRRSE